MSVCDTGHLAKCPVSQTGATHSLWGTTWTGTTWWDPVSGGGGGGGANGSRVLATYQFFPHPPRFTTAAWAQVNWHYDTGHNVPANLCPVRYLCTSALSCHLLAVVHYPLLTQIGHCHAPPAGWRGMCDRLPDHELLVFGGAKRRLGRVAKAAVALPTGAGAGAKPSLGSSATSACVLAQQESWLLSSTYVESRFFPL